MGKNNLSAARRDIEQASVIKSVVLSGERDLDGFRNLQKPELEIEFKSVEHQKAEKDDRRSMAKIITDRLIVFRKFILSLTMFN